MINKLRRIIEIAPDVSSINSVNGFINGVLPESKQVLECLLTAKVFVDLITPGK